MYSSQHFIDLRHLEKFLEVPENKIKWNKWAKTIFAWLDAILKRQEWIFCSLKYILPSSAPCFFIPKTKQPTSLVCLHPLQNLIRKTIRLKFIQGFREMQWERLFRLFSYSQLNFGEILTAERTAFVKHAGATSIKVAFWSRNCKLLHFIQV